MVYIYMRYTKRDHRAQKYRELILKIYKEMPIVLNIYDGQVKKKGRICLCLECTGGCGLIELGIINGRD